MRVIDLDNRVVRQVIEITALCRTFVQDQLSRAAHHEILLVDAQQSSLFITVVRIQEERQIPLNVLFVKIDPLSHNGLVHGVKVKKMKFIRLIVVPGHFNVVHPGIDLPSSELHRVHHIRPFQPGSVLDPGIRRLLLQMILKHLPEEAQMIVQSDAVPGQAQCGHRVQETRRQPSQPAVSKRRLRLDLLDLTETPAVFLQHLFHFLVNAEIDQVI